MSIWVLAGPVLARLAELLDALRRGYHTKEETLRQPRGRILWDRYISRSLVSGRWADLPCRFPELSTDPMVRRMARWGLERVRSDLVAVGGRDAVARLLLAVADDLLFRVRDVLPLAPRRGDLDRLVAGDRLLGVALRRGLEALGWVSEERGLGHLVPDIVVLGANAVHVIDAKYKAHLAELDEHGWQRFTEDRREAHRADIHQVLAYAALYSADEVSASLVYPLRHATFEALARRGRDRSVAHLLHGARRVRLELRGVPFGMPAHRAPEAS